LSKLSLLPADPTLKEPKVIAPFCLTPMTKAIEQVGMGYEHLKKRYAHLEMKMKIGASAHFSDCEEDDDPTVSKRRQRVMSLDTDVKKQLRKDRMAIEKTFCKEGNLYGVLELENVTWEATVKQVLK